MLFKNNISPLPFKVWLCQDRENKLLFGVTLIVMALSFGWLKYVYPYPNFMPPDSYNYLESATNNDFINMWPIGYPKFLRLVSVFTRSDLALVLLQYIFLIAAVLYFLFTLRYFVSPGLWLFRIVLALSVSNPLLPHIANFVSSDALFASLSLIWFTQLLWILYLPTRNLLLTHALILLMAFMVRFIALYYPILSITIIFFSHIPASKIKLGIFSIALLILTFIGRTQYEYKIKTATIQYSAFGGWQIAANALYGYAYADSIPVAKAPLGFRELHGMVNLHMDSLRHLYNRPDKEPGVYYMWDFKSPLFQYVYKHKEQGKKYFEQWAKFGPVYAKYGRWLIMQQPSTFIKHYIWPNLLRYYAPPAQFMGIYNLGKTTVDPIVVSWFAWKNNQLISNYNYRQIHIMNILSNLLTIINPSFLVFAMLFIGFAGLKQCSTINKKILSCLLMVWLANTFFSVFSAPIELRYQIFPTVLTVTFCPLLLSWIVQSLRSAPNLPQKQKTEFKSSYTIHP